ncbi:MAG TPA: phosphohistidine phosphatase SixA [Syntrophorhabdaceae bacterium]|jgi:phosphohistidine phosphatase|nr:phosphohistidine phosphatase SixA [Syntrophorhabdaceae bacterium]
MFLYLVQHGEAKKEEEDPARGLAEKGAGDVRRVAAYCARSGIALSRVFESGKTRATQTAGIFSDLLHSLHGVKKADGLSPMDDPKVWRDRMTTVEEDVMLVGHLPHLGRLASLLVCGDSEKGVVNFKMGCVVCLRRSEEDRWAVEWMVIPERCPEL